MKTISFQLPTIEQVNFEIQCLPEDMPIRGNAIASGDDEYDKEVEDKLIAESEWNEWAWCMVKITAKYKGAKGTDYLGGCSYKNEKDFIQNSGYFEDMKQNAYAELLTELENMND